MLGLVLIAVGVLWLIAVLGWECISFRRKQRLIKRGMR